MKFLLNLGFIASLTLTGSLSSAQCLQDVTGSQVGTTKYDLQSNGSLSQRLVLRPNGRLHAIWTGSTNSARDFADRGTFYAVNSGSGWGTAPNKRIETQRSGWPSLAITKSGKEVVSTHAFDVTNNVYETIINRRNSAGSGSWTESSPGFKLVWCKTVAGGKNGESIHLIGRENSTGFNALKYCRSTNAGLSWDIKEATLPGLSPNDGFDQIQADEYSIDAMGDTIAIVTGGQAGALVLLKSVDNGANWTKTMVWDTPIRMDGNTFSDVNNDGQIDTVFVPDIYPHVILDKNGLAHVFVGRMVVFDDDDTDGQWSYFPLHPSSGLVHWSEKNSSNGPQPVLEYGEGRFGLPVNSSGVAPFRAGVFTMPSASLDYQSGDIYVVCSGPYEADFPGKGNATLRTLWGVKINADGTVQTSGSSFTERTGGLFGEHVFPSVPKRSYGEVHVLHQQDTSAGTLIQTNGHSDTLSLMMHSTLHYKLFENCQNGEISYTKDIVTCEDDETMVLAPKDYCGYRWFVDNRGVSATDTFYADRSMVNSNIILEVTDSFGCANYSGDDNITVSNSVKPNARIKIPAVTEVCGNNLIELEVVGNEKSYVWSTSETERSIKVGPGDFYVVAINEAGCTDTSDVIEIVEGNPNLGVSFSANQRILRSKPFQVVFDNLTPSPSQYDFTWRFGDDSSSTATSPIHTYIKEGLYSVSLLATRKNDGCVDSLYQEDYIECTLPVSIGQQSPSEPILYPNPSRGSLNIELGKLEAAVFSLFDSQGKLVRSQQLAQGLNTLNVESLNPGPYRYHLHGDGSENYYGTLSIQD